MDESTRITALVSALNGSLIAALSDVFNEMVKELRRSGIHDLDHRLDVLKAKSVRAIENAPLDGIPEDFQLIVTEQTRAIVSAIIDQARDQR